MLEEKTALVLIGWYNSFSLWNEFIFGSSLSDQLLGLAWWCTHVSCLVKNDASKHWREMSAWFSFCKELSKHCTHCADSFDICKDSFFRKLFYIPTVSAFQPSSTSGHPTTQHNLTFFIISFTSKTHDLTIQNKRDELPNVKVNLIFIFVAVKPLIFHALTLRLSLY